MRLVSWGATDLGRARKVNEDGFMLAPEQGLVAVADGMGGYQRGDVASQLACNVIKESLKTHRHVVDMYRRSPSEATRSAVRTMIDAAMQKACEEVHQAALAITGRGGHMGTTMDLLMLIGRTAFLGHVGDGRIYLLRGGESHLLTQDHSLNQDAVDGTASVKESGARNVITRALGVFPSVLVDTLAFDIDVGDRLVVCTDGLHRYVEADELTEEVTKGSVEQVVDRLVNLANQRGGRDNITVVVCVVEGETQREAKPATLQRMEMLRKVDLFQYCTYRELMRVCQVAEQRDVAAGSLLFQEGTMGRECYIIEQGRVSIHMRGVELAVLEVGAYFGEMSFIDVPRRSATAVALTDAKLLIIRRNQFLQLLKQDSELAAKLMWQLLHKFSRLLRDANQKLVRDLSLTDQTTERSGRDMGGMYGDTILEGDD